jgi:hypothetical protein
MASFTCTCGRRLRAKAKYAGRHMRCPQCGAMVTVPGERAGLSVRQTPKGTPETNGRASEPNEKAPAKEPSDAKSPRQAAGQPRLPSPGAGEGPGVRARGGEDPKSLLDGLQPAQDA